MSQTDAGVLDIIRRVTSEPATTRYPLHDQAFGVTVTNTAIPLEDAPDTRPYEGVPSDVADVWRSYSEVRLYEDVSYGQWGLIIWGAATAMARNEEFRKLYPGRFEAGDLLIAEWLGDTSLLAVNGDPAGPVPTRVYMVNPMDDRSDWPIIGSSLKDFLRRFVLADGRRYWIAERGSD